MSRDECRRYSDQATGWMTRGSDPCRDKRYISSAKVHMASGGVPQPLIERIMWIPGR